MEPRTSYRQRPEEKPPALSLPKGRRLEGGHKEEPTAESTKGTKTDEREQIAEDRKQNTEDRVDSLTSGFIYRWTKLIWQYFYTRFTWLDERQ